MINRQKSYTFMCWESKVMRYKIVIIVKHRSNYISVYYNIKILLLIVQGAESAQSSSLIVLFHNDFPLAVSSPSNVC